jgi:hypothetical protein
MIHGKVRVFAVLALIFILAVFSMNFAAFAEEGADPAAEPPPTPADTALLEQAIDDATSAKSGVRPSTDGSDIRETDLWAPQPAFSALNASINEAKEALKKSDLTQEQADTQTAALYAAVDIFNKALKYGTKTEETQVTPELVSSISLKSRDLASDGKYHFAGEDFEAKYKTINISEKGKTIQLNGYYTTNKSDGAMFESVDNSSPLGPVALSWKSSNNAVAVISPDGLITPIGDGEVKITATVSEDIKYEGSAPSKSVTLKVSGQTGAYVKSVTIIDEDGKSLSGRDDAATVISGKNIFFQFYAKVVWHDPATNKDRVEDTRKDKVSSTIKWTIGGSNVCGTINESTGRFKSSEYSGNCFVQCAVTGGVDGKTLKDTAPLQVDTGEYSYKPADSLTLKVVYQEFPDKIAQEHKYPLSTLLKKLGTHTNTYTVLGGSRYGVIRAKGFLFKDIVGLEGVEIDEVYQFRFTTADGYNNPITSKLLYGSGARYYFPNWDVGGSRSGSKVVPPILATESNMIWGESEIDESAAMDSATRFRLVFGPLWSGESNSSFQIYYIKAITIVLKGAPPADNGNGTGTNSGDGDSGGKKDGDDKKSDKPESGTGADSGGGNGGAGGGSSGSGMDKAGPGGAGAGQENGNSGAGADIAKGGDIDGAAGADNSASPAKGNKPNKNSGGDWKIYEMISNSKSNVAPINMELPYLSAAAPIAAGSVAIGGLSFLIGFRRRLIY